MILEEIKRKKEQYPDMTEALEIQYRPDSWKKVRLWYPRRSAGKKILWPFQKVWRYTHIELCSGNPSGGIGQLSGLYQRWFYLYLTDEEYIMAKMES